MTVIFRRALTLMERHDCDSTGCILPAGFSLQEGPLEVFVCSVHDQQCTFQSKWEGCEVLDVSYEAVA
jgi:hypothetical protein